MVIELEVFFYQFLNSKFNLSKNLLKIYQKLKFIKIEFYVLKFIHNDLNVESIHQVDERMTE